MKMPLCNMKVIGISLMLTCLNVSAVEVGSLMPKCTLTDLADGKNVDLNQFKDKIVYVDFWASWCGPCAKLFPYMNAMHQQLKDKGLVIVAVNLDENVEEAQGFLAKYPAAFTVLADSSKDKQCAQDFAVKAMPSSYIIDREGKVHHVHLGFKEGEAQEVKALVENLLAAK